MGCKNYFLSSFHTAYFNSAVDTFAEVAKELNYSLPPSAWKKDGVDKYNMFMDGKVWDPNKAVEYIYSTGIDEAKVSKE